MDTIKGNNSLIMKKKICTSHIINIPYNNAINFPIKNKQTNSDNNALNIYRQILNILFI